MEELEEARKNDSLKMSSEQSVAIDKYREACRLAPQLPEYWTYLAIALLQDGNVEEFESSLENALNIDPFHADSLKLLGDLCFQNNKNYFFFSEHIKFFFFDLHINKKKIYTLYIFFCSAQFPKWSI